MMNGHRHPRSGGEQARARELAAELRRLAEEPGAPDVWEARRRLKELYDCDPRVAVEVGEELLQCFPDGTSTGPVAGALAWAHYRAAVKAPADETRLSDEALRAAKVALRRIHELNADDLYGTYSAFPLSALALARRARKGGRADYAVVLLEYLDVDELDATPGTFRDREQPSLKESWYTTYAAALRDLEEWGRARDAARDGLTLAHLHRDTKRELLWSLGVALHELGDSEAIEVLDEHAKLRAEPWALARLAHALDEAGRRDEAWSVLRRMLGGLRRASVVTVPSGLLLAAEVLIELSEAGDGGVAGDGGTAGSDAAADGGTAGGVDDAADGGTAGSDDGADGGTAYLERARDLVRLVRWSRAVEGWKPQARAEGLARRLGIAAEDPSALTRREAEDLLARIRGLGPAAGRDRAGSGRGGQRTGRGGAHRRGRRENGTVRKLLNEGSGFITRDRGGELYFGMPRGVPAPPAGTRVSFEVITGFDKKKNRPSDKAVAVRPIERPEAG